MMIAEPVQELSFWLPHLEKRCVISLHPALHRALWCAGHPAYVSRAIFVSVFIQCYFTHCVVLASSAQSEQCELSLFDSAYSVCSAISCPTHPVTSPSVFVVCENPFSLLRDSLVNLERRTPVDLYTWYISGD